MFNRFCRYQQRRVLKVLVLALQRSGQGMMKVTNSEATKILVEGFSATVHKSTAFSMSLPNVSDHVALNLLSFQSPLNNIREKPLN
ncbi:hypothetical protein P8452_48283 [Trifolium repens]|nr:hypothetical protein P8452_48283 [Trifolium repens]